MMCDSFACFWESKTERLENLIGFSMCGLFIYNIRSYCCTVVSGQASCSVSRNAFALHCETGIRDMERHFYIDTKTKILFSRLFYRCKYDTFGFRSLLMNAIIPY
ncbi:hypothetical protein M758_5G170800 [Ceratodon purpureus]|uniref:Uncharacterized protein n=1 Tax=Ceratodon purpureus TaxID=3225 RepID=A0A8T0I4A9_CERPU|nr:hypothetical protein KC19_5G178400 [Ceratodon purpureus]KAG0617185.1 hypothetical protein M758_5G170800 [Ceratodon purpureus]